MYVKTTPVESLSTIVSTTHISFLWTMLALAAGVGLGMACMAPRSKKEEKKDGDEKDSEDSDESSDESSDSE
jgi:hypothetical protein